MLAGRLQDYNHGSISTVRFNNVTFLPTLILSYLLLALTPPFGEIDGSCHGFKGHPWKEAEMLIISSYQLLIMFLYSFCSPILGGPFVSCGETGQG